MRHLEGRSGKRCYFAVTQEGKPYRVQRKPFTECFYVMALAEMSRAAKKPAYMVSLKIQLFFLVRSMLA